MAERVHAPDALDRETARVRGQSLALLEQFRRGAQMVLAPMRAQQAFMENMYHGYDPMPAMKGAAQ